MPAWDRRKIADRRDRAAFNTLSRSITRIMKGSQSGDGNIGSLTEYREKVRKLLIKPKEAGAYHF